MALDSRVNVAGVFIAGCVAGWLLTFLIGTPSSPLGCSMNADSMAAAASAALQSSSEAERVKRMTTKYGISCTNYLPGNNEEEVQKQYASLMSEFAQAYDRSAESLINNHPVASYVALRASLLHPRMLSSPGPSSPALSLALFVASLAPS